MARLPQPGRRPSPPARPPCTRPARSPSPGALGARAPTMPPWQSSVSTLPGANRTRGASASARSARTSASRASHTTRSTRTRPATPPSSTWNTPSADPTGWCTSKGTCRSSRPPTPPGPAARCSSRSPTGATARWFACATGPRSSWSRPSGSSPATASCSATVGPSRSAAGSGTCRAARRGSAWPPRSRSRPEAGRCGALCSSASSFTPIPSAWPSPTNTSAGSASTPPCRWPTSTIPMRCCGSATACTIRRWRSTDRPGASPGTPTSSSMAGSAPGASTTWSTRPERARSSAPGCWPCATSPRSCATATRRSTRWRGGRATSSPPASPSAGGSCGRCCTPGSTETRRPVGPCSTASWPTSPGAGAASSTSASPSLRCSPRRGSGTSSPSRTRRRPTRAPGRPTGCSPVPTPP